MDNVITSTHALYHGDSVELMKSLPDESIGFTCFSPPYGALYVYSNLPNDIGNCKSDEQFREHFGFIVNDLMRVTKPGRLVAVDCMNIPAMKERDGYIGLKDFRGELIKQFQDAGWIFHSEHCIWKDPLIEATRTKSLGLMHKQLCKDSAMCRAGIPQYLLAFRKPGVNPEPVAHTHGLEWFTGEDGPKHGNLSHERWRRYASPVWMDISFSRTLNFRAARENEDERHICPMSLDIIDRGIELWSNPGDTVFDPFSGIGSTAYCAVRNGRKAIGFELKRSYFEQAVRNVARGVSERPNMDLFAEEEMQATA